MEEPTHDELTDSIVRAGTWEGLKIQLFHGIPHIVERDEAALTPPIAMRFSPDTLLAYYRRIARDGSRGSATTSWDWWMVLMSTHLGEAIYDLDRIDGPAVITIGKFGFTATPIRGC
ncbi:hypothetical protein ACIA5H_34015 [Nocardia sp. NPDC051900]|uniref:hypothetical protein n=1 Tax=Nocardia sp. NPDC051900 TaxID=3364326 RepID=UPI0037BA2D06